MFGGGPVAGGGGIPRLEAVVIDAVVNHMQPGLRDAEEALDVAGGLEKTGFARELVRFAFVQDEQVDSRDQRAQVLHHREHFRRRELAREVAVGGRGDVIDEGVEEVRAQVGGERVICALSGGVDSSVAALLAHRAVGERLTSVFVDNGLLRKDEALQIWRAGQQRDAANDVLAETLTLVLPAAPVFSCALITPSSAPALSL